MRMRREISQELQRILPEATRALAHLEAERLEEMVVSFAGLLAGDMPRESLSASSGESSEDARASDMAVFTRVLEATRANLRVMRRLREVQRLPLKGACNTGEDTSEEDE